MKPRLLLRPGQAAWLAEIGVDVHWLGERPCIQPAPAAQESLDPVAAAALLAQPLEALSAELPQALSAASPQALSAAIEACTRCARHAARMHAVAGSGVVDRPWYLIVGEQPGIEDDAAGQPFQGPQGVLLQAMLAASRLPHRDSVFQTYVVKCRATGGHEPDATEIAACLPWLHQQIKLLQPRWILAMGRVAAQAVLKTDQSLEALRGGPHAYQPQEGAESIPVWVTHQPSSLLVRSSLKAEAWRDLLALGEAVRQAG